MEALTPGRRHLGRQVSPLISHTLPDVPPPTTWQVPSSLCPPCQRDEWVSGFATSQRARHL